MVSMFTLRKAFASRSLPFAVATLSLPTTTHFSICSALFSAFNVKNAAYLQLQFSTVILCRVGGSSRHSTSLNDDGYGTGPLYSIVSEGTVLHDASSDFGDDFPSQEAPLLSRLR